MKKLQKLVMSAMEDKMKSAFMDEYKEHKRQVAVGRIFFARL